MPFVFKSAQKAVASFVLIAFFLLTTVIVLVGKGSGIFDRKDFYTTYMTTGHGLSEGTSIEYKEFEVGKIQRMDLTEDDQIRVTVSIAKAYSRKLIHKDTVLKVSSGGLLGGGGLEMMSYTDTEGEFLEPGSVIFSSDMEDGQDLLAIYELETVGDDLMLKVNEILDMVAGFDPLLTDILQNVGDATDNLNKIVGGLAGTEYSYLSAELLESMWRINGLLDTLDSETVATLNETLDNVNQMTEEDLDQILLLLEEDLMELKKVMQNLPFGIGTGSSDTSSGIQVGDR